MKDKDNAAKLKRLREKARAAGDCYVCRARPAKPGCFTCQHCIDLAKTRSRTLAAAGKCRNCGEASGGTHLCQGCQYARRRVEESINWSEWAIGNCKECHREREQLDRIFCNRCLVRAAEGQRRRWLRLGENQP